MDCQLIFLKYIDYLVLYSNYLNKCYNYEKPSNQEQGFMNLRLKTLRQQKNINQAELGKILDVGKTTISNYETGYSVPDLETVVKLADYFDVSTDYLLGRTNYPKMCTEQIFQTTSLLAENEIEVLEILRKVNDRQQIKLIGRIEEIVKQITSEETNHKDETGGFKSNVVPSTLSKKEVG